jgi:hypothetical protein
MKHINQKSKKVLEKLINEMKNGYAKIDNTNGCFMSVSVEEIGENLFSVGHYYTQNGDLMADPEMVFWKAWDDNYYPCSWKNDGVGFNRVSVIFENGKPSSVNCRTQMQDKNFANIWMKNIKDQQEL